MFRYRRVFVGWLLVFGFLSLNQAVLARISKIQVSKIRVSTSFLADKFFRVELYFGTDKPGGGKVSEEDWDKFLETEVTPRFPDGFTVLEGFGQYKDSAGKIVREGSKILVVLYPKKSREVVNQKVEEIRTAYKKQFNQESVLRLDFVKAVDVSF